MKGVVFESEPRKASAASDSLKPTDATIGDMAGGLLGGTTYWLV